MGDEDTIRTQRLEITNEKGETCITLTGDKPGKPGMAVTGPDGAKRIHIGLNKRGVAGIALSDTNGREHAEISVDPDSRTRLVLADKRGERRVRFLLDQRGNARLDFHDRSGAVRASVTVGADGAPRVSLCNDAGKKQVRIAVDKDGTPWLCWFGIGAGVCIAKAADDDLIRWEKHPKNPIIPIPKAGQPGHGPGDVLGEGHVLQSLPSQGLTPYGAATHNGTRLSG